jgi:1,3-beta-glucanosyltransferase GAS1
MRLTTQGSKFFYSTNGSQFFVRGVQFSRHHTLPLPTIPHDSLADGMLCARDAPLLVELGINTITVADFNTLADHSACMQAFEKAGIYVIAILSLYIDAGYRVHEALVVTTDYTLYDRFVKVIDALIVHSNLMGFMVDLNDHRSDYQQKLPISKALIRDVKEHLRRSGHENIPVGAIGSNVGKSSLIPNFMSCGESQMAADFFAFEARSQEPSVDGLLWCANSSASYDTLAEQYRGHSMPVLVHYGCQENRSHTFPEVRYIYTGAGAEVFSGGIVDNWLHRRYESDQDTGMIKRVKHNNQVLT